MNVFRFIIATCVIAGFSVGLGYMSLPAIAGLAGFIPGLVAIVLIWLLGIASGLLYVEAFLATPEALHLPSICRKLSGQGLSIFASVIFLCFSYCVLLLYYMYGRDFLMTYLAPYRFPVHWALLLITLALGLLIYFGRFAALFVTACLFALFFAFFGYDFYVNATKSFPELGIKAQSIFLLFVLAVIFNISFYQSILPSLIHFLKHDRKLSLASIWVGFTVAMLFFATWLWMTLRPEVYSRFLAAFETKSSFEAGLQFLKEIPTFRPILRFLSFFAILIVLLSASLSLMDFFKDLIPSFSTTWKKVLLVLLIFIPPLIGCWVIHKNFMTPSTLVMAFSEFLMATVFPIFWVWVLRYRFHIPLKPVLHGGKPLLVVLIFASAVLLFALGTIPIHQIDL